MIETACRCQTGKANFSQAAKGVQAYREHRDSGWSHREAGSVERLQQRVVEGSHSKVNSGIGGCIGMRVHAKLHVHGVEGTPERVESQRHL